MHEPEPDRQATDPLHADTAPDAATGTGAPGPAVFDVATVLGALADAERRGGTKIVWLAANPRQTAVLEWRGRIGERAARIRGIEAVASPDAGELNAFLEGRGFGPRFDPLVAPAVGVAAAVRRSARWRSAAMSVPLRAAGVEYHAFTLEGVEATGYAVGTRTLVSMPFEPGDDDRLWLLLGDDLPEAGDDVATFEAAADALRGRAAASRVIHYTSVTVPEVRIETIVELDWLDGLQAQSVADGGAALARPIVARAIQAARLQIDRSASGATLAPVLTGRGFVARLTVERPFVGFWTDAAAPELPIGAARFDFASWAPFDADRADRENEELSAADEDEESGDGGAVAAGRGIGGALRRLFGRH